MPRARSHHRFVIAVLLGLSSGSLASSQYTCDGISPSLNTTVEGVTVATGLTGRPIFVAAPPGDTRRIFIVEQDGLIQIKKRGDPVAAHSLFLDISDKVSTADDEMGLLGLAFDPDYATNGYFYVNYTESNGGYFTVVARYSVTADPDVADPESEVRVLRFSQPQTNHNGGQLDFGPDGYLYVFSGDGGGSDDFGPGHAACGNGQSKTTLLGKILRIDVRGIAPSSRPPDCSLVAGPYTIPTDNPLDDGAGGNCDEIWAYGLRNPWRSSFDALTGDLYLADVGQACREEVNYVESPGDGGYNFGWRVMEGLHCFDTRHPSQCDDVTPQSCFGVPLCNDPSLALPALEYSHDTNECAVAGGYVYRGCRMPAFFGTYFYGDYCAGFVKSLVVSDGVPTDERDWTPQVDPQGVLFFGLSSFGTDAYGEIYVTSLFGEVLKIVPPLPDLEVSGPGAADMLLLSKTEDWTWEDLHASTDLPVNRYRIYRGKLGGGFQCIHTATEPRWNDGGDPWNPAVGNLLLYVVTALNAAGEESATGYPGTFHPSDCP